MIDITPKLDQLEESFASLDIKDKDVLDTAKDISRLYQQRFSFRSYDPKLIDSAAIAISIWANEYPYIIENVYKELGIRVYLVHSVTMEIELQILPQLNLSLPQRTFGFWSTHFKDRFNLNDNTFQMLNKYIDFLQIRDLTRVDKDRCQFTFFILYYLLTEEEYQSYNSETMNQIINTLICPIKGKTQFMSLYREFKKDFHRFDHFIPNLIEKIKNNEELTEYDRNYPLYAKFADFLKEICMFNPTETASEVLEIIKKKSFISIPNSKFKIWL